MKKLKITSIMLSIVLIIGVITGCVSQQSIEIINIISSDTYFQVNAKQKSEDRNTMVYRTLSLNFNNTNYVMITANEYSEKIDDSMILTEDTVTGTTTISSYEAEVFKNDMNIHDGDAFIDMYNRVCDESENSLIETNSLNENNTQLTVGDVVRNDDKICISAIFYDGYDNKTYYRLFEFEKNSENDYLVTSYEGTSLAENTDMHIISQISMNANSVDNFLKLINTSDKEQIFSELWVSNNCR